MNFRWLMSLVACAAFYPQPTEAADYFPAPEVWGGCRSLVTANAIATAEQRAAVREQAEFDWEQLHEAWVKDQVYATRFG